MVCGAEFSGLFRLFPDSFRQQTGNSALRFRRFVWYVTNDRTTSLLDDILRNRGPERQIDLIGDLRTSPGRIAVLHLDDGMNKIRVWTFWPRFRSLPW